MIQGPSLQLPWYDSQLFGSTVTGAVIAFTAWITNRKANTIKAVVDETKVVSDKTHILVNSQMGTQLKINEASAAANVASSEALYEITKKPEHFALLNTAKGLLEDAQRALAEHNRKQALVDSGKVG
jgi:hypothetical protein